MNQPEGGKADIFLLSGRIEGGKTTFLRQLSDRLEEAGYQVAGLLSMALFEQGERKGFMLEAIPGGEHIPLGIKESREGWIRQGRYHLNPQAFDSGLNLARKALENAPDIFLLDEVGHLELSGRGWSALIEELFGQSALLQLWTVRESLSPKVAARYAIPGENMMDCGSLDPEEALNLVIESLNKNKNKNK